MANWDKLNKEFDDVLDNMTDKDWKDYLDKKGQKILNWWGNLSQEDQDSLGLTFDDIKFIYEYERITTN